MRLKEFKDNSIAVVDVSIAILIGIVFVSLMVIAYLIWTFRALFTPAVPLHTSSVYYNTTYRAINNSLGNLTSGFDQTIKIIIVAILVSVLAIALSYLMMLRHST